MHRFLSPRASKKCQGERQEGLGQRAIARQLRISRNTVQRYVSSPGFPERAEGSGLRASRKSKLDAYLPYLREQWNAGIHNGSRLFDLVKERGYTGCQSGLRKRLGSRGGQSCHPDGGGGIHPNRVFSRKGVSAVFPRGQPLF